MPGRIPVEVVFNPNWWFRNYGIAFDESFYFDRHLRIAHDVTMRRTLWERFGLGGPDPCPRPVVGSQHVAGGFVVPALLGVEIRFSANDAPWPVAANLSREQALALRVPDIESTWPMDRLIADMDALEREFGCVIGDFGVDGVINTALHLRGNDLFIDMKEDPEAADHLFAVAAETGARVAEYVRRRTGTCAVACNRSILRVDPRAYIHGNCSIQMISPALYRARLLPFELRLAERLRPYGIHHCGNNLHLFAESYRETGAIFYDVGWGSDVVRVSRLLPDAFLNLRLSPIRMLREDAAAIRADTLKLLEACGRTRNVGVCCINMDHGTPDANVLAILRAAGEFAAS